MATQANATGGAAAPPLPITYKAKYQKKKERIDIYFNSLYLSTSRIVCTIRDFTGTEDSLRHESDWEINWDGVRNRVF